MTSSPQSLFPVGKIVGFLGLKGDVKVRPVTNNPELLLDMKEVEIRLPDGAPFTVRIEKLALVRRLLIIRLEGYGDRTAAEDLINAELFTDRACLRDLDADEWWTTDLLGMEVFTTGGAYVGVVHDIIDAGNQLLEIAPARQQTNDPQGKTILVPFVKALVPLVDLKSRRVEVIDVPGLLEPQ